MKTVVSAREPSTQKVMSISSKISDTMQGNELLSRSGKAEGYIFPRLIVQITS